MLTDGLGSRVREEPPFRRLFQFEALKIDLAALMVSLSQGFSLPCFIFGIYFRGGASQLYVSEGF